MPVILDATSTQASVATLNVSTREAGVADGDIVEFIIKVTLLNDGTSKLFVQEFSDYVDSTTAILTIDGLIPDVEYQFNVRVRNTFGISEFSETIALRIHPLPLRASTFPGKHNNIHIC